MALRSFFRWPRERPSVARSWSVSFGSVSHQYHSGQTHRCNGQGRGSRASAASPSSRKRMLRAFCFGIYRITMFEVSDQLSLLLLVSSFELHQLVRDLFVIVDRRSNTQPARRIAADRCHTRVIFQQSVKPCDLAHTVDQSVGVDLLSRREQRGNGQATIASYGPFGPCHVPSHGVMLRGLGGAHAHG